MGEQQEQRERQTEALDRIGFGPAFMVGGGTFSPVAYFATCRTCGAACHILAGVPDEEQPTYTHKAWHDGGAR